MEMTVVVVVVSELMHVSERPIVGADVLPEPVVVAVVVMQASVLQQESQYQLVMRLIVQLNLLNQTLTDGVLMNWWIARNQWKQMIESAREWSLVVLP